MLKKKVINKKSEQVTVLQGFPNFFCIILWISYLEYFEEIILTLKGMC